LYNARIGDFGMNVALRYTGLPTSGGSRGTMTYMTPEIIDDDDSAHTQIDNAYIPTRKSDIFASSVLIWEVRSQS
jgi:serine/threonine protein kinase